MEQIHSYENQYIRFGIYHLIGYQVELIWHIKVLAFLIFWAVCVTCIRKRRLVLLWIVGLHWRRGRLGWLVKYRYTLGWFAASLSNKEIYHWCYISMYMLGDLEIHKCGHVSYTFYAEKISYFWCDCWLLFFRFSTMYQYLTVSFINLLVVKKTINFKASFTLKWKNIISGSHTQLIKK